MAAQSGPPPSLAELTRQRPQLPRRMTDWWLFRQLGLAPDGPPPAVDQREIQPGGGGVAPVETAPYPGLPNTGAPGERGENPPQPPAPAAPAAPAAPDPSLAAWKPSHGPVPRPEREAPATVPTTTTTPPTTTPPTATPPPTTTPTQPQGTEVAGRGATDAATPGVSAPPPAFDVTDASMRRYVEWMKQADTRKPLTPEEIEERDSLDTRMAIAQGLLGFSQALGSARNWGEAGASLAAGAGAGLEYKLAKEKSYRDKEEEDVATNREYHQKAWDAALAEATQRAHYGNEGRRTSIYEKKTAADIIHDMVMETPDLVRTIKSMRSELGMPDDQIAAWLDKNKDVARDPIFSEYVDHYRKQPGVTPQQAIDMATEMVQRGKGQTGEAKPKAPMTYEEQAKWASEELNKDPKYQLADEPTKARMRAAKIAELRPPEQRAPQSMEAQVKAKFPNAQPDGQGGWYVVENGLKRPVNVNAVK